MKPRDAERIEELRLELHRLIEQENELSSKVVQKLSRELDQLILMYYDEEGMDD